jgi:hypothetical protein
VSEWVEPLTSGTGYTSHVPRLTRLATAFSLLEQALRQADAPYTPVVGNGSQVQALTEYGIMVL